MSSENQAFSFDDHCAMVAAKHPEWLKGNNHGATSLMAVAKEFWEAAHASTCIARQISILAMVPLEQECERIREMVVPQHEHVDGQNECAICDQPLSQGVREEINRIERQRDDLLEACHAAMNWFTPPNDSKPFPGAQIAAAIRKAQGE